MDGHIAQVSRVGMEQVGPSKVLKRETREAVGVVVIRWAGLVGGGCVLEDGILDTLPPRWFTHDKELFTGKAILEQQVGETR